jgi:mannose-6-phosphate isomerase
MTDLYPMLIEPHFDERIWGGHNLAVKFGKAAPPNRLIGESWEIYEQNRVINGAYSGSTIGELRSKLGSDLMGHVPADQLFPLLTKLIDAQDVLSVQVHPDDEFARRVEHQPYGKTECWYILDAKPDAHLIYGFNRDITVDEYKRLVAEGSLDKVLRQLPVQPGDVVYLPARTVHAIGAGIVLFELQQTSDVTYRIYDWNRRDSSGKTRELHVDKALQVLDFHRCERQKIHILSSPEGKRSVLIGARYFCLELTEAGAEKISTYGSPVALCALETPLKIETAAHRVSLPRYSSLLIPAAAQNYSILSTGAQSQGRALVAYIPTSVGETRKQFIQRGFHEHQVDDFLTQFAPAN